MAYAEFKEGRVEGLVEEPRLDIDYIVYLRGVYSKDIYRIIESLELKGYLERLDEEVYRIKKTIDEESLARLLDGETMEALRQALRYKDVDAEILESIVNRILGIDDPRAKALIFGASVKRLLYAKRKARELEAQGMLVDL